MNQDNPFAEIEAEITRLKKVELDSVHKIEEMSDSHEKKLDEIFKDLIAVLDAFEKADGRLIEQFPEDENVQKARKRFATTKKKILDLFEKNGVTKITFQNGIAKLEDCQIVDTEPDSSKDTDTIISIEKEGYRRNGRLLRLSEVIVVKN